MIKHQNTITIFSEDPCLKLDIGSNSYCLGGVCYCTSGNYDENCSNDGDGVYENDFIDHNCAADGLNCSSFDYCNPPPGIFGVENVTTDHDVTITFTTNESARATIYYGKTGFDLEPFPDPSGTFKLETLVEI